jgi:acetyl esterase/lipase
MAERLAVVVVSVDYGLALTRPITKVADHCAAAMLWTIENAQARFGVDKIVVKGSSAGAHLAAAALLRLRD